jgi:hypothetical protein
MQSKVSPLAFKIQSLPFSMLSHSKRESILCCLYQGHEGTGISVVKAVDHYYRVYSNKIYVLFA